MVFRPAPVKPVDGVPAVPGLRQEMLGRGHPRAMSALGLLRAMLGHGLPQVMLAHGPPPAQRAATVRVHRLRSATPAVHPHRAAPSAALTAVLPRGSKALAVALAGAAVASVVAAVAVAALVAVVVEAVDEVAAVADEIQSMDQNIFCHYENS